MTHLGKGTIVPQVALVGEAVADVAELALLDVLLDGVEQLLLGDLSGEQRNADRSTLSAWRFNGRRSVHTSEGGAQGLGWRGQR